MKNSNFTPTKYSLDIVKEISSNMEGVTFNHHYHFLWDLRNSMSKEVVSYLEIGTCSGGSSCLMLKSPRSTKVLGVDYFPQNEVVNSNVKKFKLPHNEFEYLVGDSRDKQTIDRVSTIMPEVDILFIDGDHQYYSVIDDFLNYQNLVISGGYIIFDDYHDWKYCPEVQHAVNHIVDYLLFDNYEVLGYFKNTLGAHPKNMLNYNQFILRKK